MKSFILQISEKLQEFALNNAVLQFTADEFDGVTVKLKESDKPGAKEWTLLIPFENFYKKGEGADAEALQQIFVSAKAGKKV
jgi:hypothetical protein